MMALNVDAASKDMDAAIDLLLERRRGDLGQVGVIGFCMGGGLALVVACKSRDQGRCGGTLLRTHSLGGRPAGLLVAGGARPGPLRRARRVLRPRGGTGSRVPAPRSWARMRDPDPRRADHAFFNDTRPEVHDAAASRSWPGTTPGVLPRRARLSACVEAHRHRTSVVAADSDAITVVARSTDRGFAWRHLQFVVDAATGALGHRRVHAHRVVGSPPHVPQRLAVLERDLGGHPRSGHRSGADARAPSRSDADDTARRQRCCTGRPAPLGDGHGRVRRPGRSAGRFPRW